MPERLNASPLRIRELPALLVLLAVFVGMYATKPSFRSPVNLSQVGLQVALLGILACGEGMVILTGGIDLSVGAVLAMSTCVAGARMQAGMDWPLAALLALLVGGIAGWINGALITYRKLTPILTTLATLLIFRAITNIETGAIPYNQLPEALKAIGRGQLPFVIFAVLVAALAIMLARARLGRRIVALAGSEQAVRLSGVSP